MSIIIFICIFSLHCVMVRHPRLIQDQAVGGFRVVAMDGASVARPEGLAPLVPETFVELHHKPASRSQPAASYLFNALTQEVVLVEGEDRSSDVVSSHHFMPRCIAFQN